MIITDTDLLGVIAQELEMVFPGLVDTDTDGIKSIEIEIIDFMIVV